MIVRRVREKRGWAVLLTVMVVKPFLTLVSRKKWINGEQIPAEGGCIVVLNHISHIDPLMSAHFVYNHGRVPRYLAKSGLFKVAVVGKVLSSAQQIPVERLTSSAADAYGSAVQAIKDGKCVIIYPEGTITRDPDLWPMRGKSGAARIALATGCPVIPVGQWGAQKVLAPYGKRLHGLARHTVTFKAGPPVDLSDLVTDDTPSSAVVNQATDRIMQAIAALVGELRGETPPTELFDMRGRGIPEIGDPSKQHKPSPEAPREGLG